MASTDESFFRRFFVSTSRGKRETKTTNLPSDQSCRTAEQLQDLKKKEHRLGEVKAKGDLGESDLFSLAAKLGFQEEHDWCLGAPSTGTWPHHAKQNLPQSTERKRDKL